MELETTIILILICAFILYLAKNHFGGVFKIISAMLFIIMIISAIGIYLVVKDLSNLKEDMTTKNSIFIIKDETKIYSAIELNPTKNKNVGIDDINHYNQTKLLELEQMIKTDEFTEANGRIFLITPEVLDKNISLDLGIEIDQKDMINIVKSDYPYDTIAQIIIQKQNITGLGLEYAIQDLKRMFGPEEKIKGYITSILIANYFSQSKPIINEIKTDTIQILPQTISFKLIKYIPLPESLIAAN